MAAKLERFASPGKGNGLRASVGVRSGQLLFSAEPLAACVSNKMTKSICHHCFTRRETLLRCSQCKMARYCNINCQKLAWPVHKSECKCLRSILPRIPTDSVRLAARIVFALLSNMKDNGEELYTLEEHETHLSSVSEQKREGLSQLASMLQLYLQQEVPALDKVASSLPSSCRDPLSLMGKVTCNCFTISDAELQEVGVGLYPSLSLLNHDCGPNCVMVFEGTKLHLRAVKDIEVGEELSISYIDSLALTDERQKQLKEQYHFTCHCQRCDSRDKDEMMASGEATTCNLLKDALPRLDELKAKSNWPELLDLCKRLLSSAGDTVPQSNLSRLKVTDAALDACVQLGLWEEALTYGLKTLPVYRLYFPEPHPVHGIQLMRIGKLQYYLEHIADAFDSFKQSFEILKVTHGGDHPLTSDLQMKMEECRCELNQ